MILQQAEQVIGILLFMGIMAAIPALGAVLWYTIKVWFTTNVIKKTWINK